MHRNCLIIGLACAAFACLGTGIANAADEIDAKEKKICEKAEQRYQKIFGKPSADEDVTIVKMYKYKFCPRNIVVKPGQKVRWVNVDKRTSHSIWFKDQGKPESGRLFGEENVEMTIDLPAGNQPYICGPHFERDKMAGSITVSP